MANPSLQIGNSNWAIKEDNLLGYSTAGTRFVPQPITMTRESAGTRVNSSGLVETVELLGSEEIVNGDFATDSDWVKGTNITISNGSAVFTDVTPYAELRQNSVFTIGKTYKINFTVSGFNGGSVLVQESPNVNPQITVINASNDYSILYTAQTTTGITFKTVSGTVSMNLYNISVKESTKNNLARVDYDGTASSLLVEPERTNEVTYSEDFSNADWGNASVGTTPVLTSGFTSPDGTDNAYKISNANQNSMWFSATLIGASDSRTIYARTVSGTGTAQLLSHNSNTNNTFNLTEEWQRFEVSATTSGIGQTSYYAVDFRGGGTLDEVLIWGAQAEVGSYPTSYIPTDGGTVTRVQDQYSKTGISNLIGQTEGTWFVDVDFDTLSGLNMFLSIRPDSNSKIEMYRDGNLIYGDIVSSSSFTFIKTGVTVGRYKIALSYSSGSSAMYINGDLISSNSTSFAFTSTLNDLYVGSRGGTSFIEQAKYNDIKLYKTRLSNSELATLTTI